MDADSSPSKRVLSDNIHSTNLALDRSQPNADQAARVRDAAMRARMNVARGYGTTRALNSPHSSPTKPPRAPEHFSSDADTLKEVFATLPPGATPPVSPTKRNVAGRHRDEEENLSDEEEMGKLMELDEPLKASRPMKPLRKGVLRTPAAGTLAQHTTAIPIKIEMAE